MSQSADTQRMAEKTLEIPLGAMARIMGARGGAARKHHPERYKLAKLAAAVRWKNHKAKTVPSDKKKVSTK